MSIKIPNTPLEVFNQVVKNTDAIADNASNIADVAEDVAAAELEITAVGHRIDKVGSAIAPAYSAESTYALGAEVMYNDELYTCSTAIETAEEWNAEHWTKAPVSELIASLQSVIATLQSSINNAGKKLYVHVSTHEARHSGSTVGQVTLLSISTLSDPYTFSNLTSFFSNNHNAKIPCVVVEATGFTDAGSQDKFKFACGGATNITGVSYMGYQPVISSVKLVLQNSSTYAISVVSTSSITVEPSSDTVSSLS